VIMKERKPEPFNLPPVTSDVLSAIAREKEQNAKRSGVHSASMGEKLEKLKMDLENEKRIHPKLVRTRRIKHGERSTDAPPGQKSGGCVCGAWIVNETHREDCPCAK